VLQKIKLSGLEVFAHHGVFSFERDQGQLFLIDATVWLDASAAAAEDKLEKTIHYGELADAIVANAAEHPVDLIETLAFRLLRLVLDFGGPETPVRKAKVTVHKPNAPIKHSFKDVSITVKGKR
jgi:dihydroneopterin aldolase